MKKAKVFISILLASLLILTQVAVAFAASGLQDATIITSTVTAVTMETDVNTGVITFLVTVEDELSGKQTVRVSEQTASNLGLIDYDDDGNPFVLDAEDWPSSIEIDPSTVIPSVVEPKHPVAAALATFFSGIEGLDYNTIMGAHTEGYGFGVIAQALWMIQKLGGTAEDFVLLLQAKKDGDYSNFPLEDGTIPTTWGQLRKAIAGNLGMIMSHNDKENKDKNLHVNKGDGSNKDKNKEKNKVKSNTGYGNTNGHGNKP